MLTVLLLGAAVSLRSRLPESAGELRALSVRTEETAAEAPKKEPEQIGSPSYTDQLRRQRLAAQGRTGLELPMNYPVTAKHITVTDEKLRYGYVTESSESSYTVLTDRYGNELGTLGSSGFSLNSLYEYDEEGRLLRSYVLSYGSVPQYQEETYREDGSLSESICFGREPDGGYRPSRYSLFDDHGSLTEEGYCYSGGRTSSKIVANSYGDEGELVLAEAFQGYESVTTDSFEYDSLHRLVRETRVMGEGRRLSKIVTEYTYLKNGSLRQRTQRSFGADGELSALTRYEYTYDGEGRILSETVRYGDFQISITEYAYEEL